MRQRPLLLSLLAAGVLFSSGCKHEPEEDLIAQAWRADVFSERVGASLIRDGDDPDLVSGWADVEVADDGTLALWATGDKSLYNFHLNRPRPLQLRFAAQPFSYPGRPLADLWVRVNGQTVGRTPLVDGEQAHAALDLPVNALQAGRNSLEFIHPWAKSPKELGQSGDLRQLSVQFSSLRLEEAKADAGSKGAPETASDHAPAVIYAGTWSDPESNALSGVRAYQWLLGTDGAVRFALVRPSGDLNFKYKAAAFEFPNAPPQAVRWLLNGRLLKAVVIRNGWNEYQLTLPEFYLRAGDNRLECHAAYARRAQQVTHTDDTRVLSFALGDVSLEPGALAFPSGTLLGAGPGRLALPAGYQIAYTFPLEAKMRLKFQAEGGAESRLRVTEEAEGIPTVELYSGRAGGNSLALPGDPGHLVQVRIANEAPVGGAPVVLKSLTLRRAAAAPLWQPSPPPAPRSAAKAAAPARTVLIYLVDTLRADHLSNYGYRRDTSPELANFSRDAEVFENAQSVTSWTKAATASVLTGLTPERHGADRQLSPLLGDVPYLPELLRGAGYHSLGIVTNPYVNADFGFNRGYDQFIFDYNDKVLAASSQDANRQLDRALAEVPELQPIFIYMHTVDPHSPYEPQPAYNRFGAGKKATASAQALNDLQFPLAWSGLPPGTLNPIIDLYDGEIAQADAGFAETLKILERHNRNAGALVIFIADHGEEFGDHHGLEHGKTLFAEVTHIPLLIRWPDAHAAGTRRAELVSQLDIAPTVLKAAGLPNPSPMGYPLDETLPVRALVSSLELEGRSERRVDWQHWSYHRIASRLSPQYYGRPLEYLYDRQGDPGEYHDLRNEQALVTAYLRALSRDTPVSAAAPAGPDTSPDESTVRQLKALGYLR